MDLINSAGEISTELANDPYELKCAANTIVVATAVVDNSNSIDIVSVFLDCNCVAILAILSLSLMISVDLALCR
jgi:hypothetical protein